MSQPKWVVIVQSTRSPKAKPAIRWFETKDEAEKSIEYGSGKEYTVDHLPEKVPSSRVTRGLTEDLINRKITRSQFNQRVQRLQGHDMGAGIVRSGRRQHIT